MSFSFNGYKELPGKTKCLFVMKFFMAYQAVLMSLLSILFNDKLGLSISVTARIMSAITVTGAVGIYLGGVIASKIGEKSAIRIFLVSAAVIYVIAGIVGNLKLFSGLFIMAIFAMMATGPATETIISTAVESRLHKKIFSFTYLGTNVGYGLWSLIITRVYSKYLSPVSFMGAAACVIMLIAFEYFIRHGNRDVTTEQETITQEPETNTFKLLRKNGMILLAVTLFCIIYCQFGFTVPIRLNNLWGDAGVSLYGVLGVINAAIVIVATPIVTSLVEKIKEKDLLAMAGILYAVSFAVLCIPISQKWLYIVWVIIFTFGEIVYSVSLSAYIASYNGAKERNKVFATSNACVLIGYVLGQNLTGLIPEDSVSINFTLISVLSFLVGIICFKCLKANAVKA